MKDVVSPDEMKKMEALAEREGVTQEALMEEAGKKIEEIVYAYIVHNKLAEKAFILAGKGNNGGDAYVVARFLLQRGFFVQVLQVHPLDSSSLVRKQRRKYEARGGKVFELSENKWAYPHEGVVVDGIFGTGFHGSLDTVTKKLIDEVNLLRLPKIAIDIPSGLNGLTGEVFDSVLSCDSTCAIEFPKLGFFFEHGWNAVGKVELCPIGLLKYKQNPPPLQFLEESDVSVLLPKITRTRHKYEAGHVVGLAGSRGMSGASLMASWAALRIGAGIVHLLYPKDLSSEFTMPPLEVVKIPFRDDEEDTVTSWITKAKSCFVGPGLGSSISATKVLEKQWPHFKDKCVLDADALNYIAKNFGDKTYGPLPMAVLTPHVGEMKRLLGSRRTAPVTYSFVQECQKYIEKNTTNLVLKGGPTFLLTSGKIPIVMPRGDPGMATAGSGDVLTGIIAGLMSQDLSPYDAMKLGTYVHGLAGELAAIDETSYSMMATSIIQFLPHAIKRLLK